ELNETRCVANDLDIGADEKLQRPRPPPYGNGAQQANDGPEEQGNAGQHNGLPNALQEQVLILQDLPKAECHVQIPLRPAACRAALAHAVASLCPFSMTGSAAIRLFTDIRSPLPRQNEQAVFQPLDLLVN